jgi:NAD(P)-dependent dehydrogenase (short-subunit alcohol dehydrogenase family)
MCFNKNSVVMEPTMQETWFVTGASRGLGAQIAKAAIRAGNRVVATSRRREALVETLGPDSDQLSNLELDVTSASEARAAVQAALSRFGAIDVLVNNDRYGYLGFFEDSAIRDTQAQFPTNLFGVLNVTGAVLPIMRSARKGRIFNISSFGGILGAELGPLHCASKFALDGISESLSREIAPFGLFVTVVEPGPLRSEFLTCDSLRDPAKLAESIVRMAGEAEPPTRTDRIEIERSLAWHLDTPIGDHRLHYQRSDEGYQECQHRERSFHSSGLPLAWKRPWSKRSPRLRPDGCHDKVDEGTHLGRR